ncbi:hypothetical protein Dimus_018688 [Dionaea muscipula]
MLQVADLVSEKIKEQSTQMQLKVEESGMDLKHLVMQKFLEHDLRVQTIEETVKEVSSSQALLTETLLKFIEDAKKGKVLEALEKSKEDQESRLQPVEQLEQGRHHAVEDNMSQIGAIEIEATRSGAIEIETFRAGAIEIKATSIGAIEIETAQIGAVEIEAAQT